MTNKDMPLFSMRVTQGKTFMRSLPLGAIYLPFVYSSALLGCWKNVDEHKESNALGDLDMSVNVTLFQAGVVYALLGRALIHHFLA